MIGVWGGRAATPALPAASPLVDRSGVSVRARTLQATYGEATVLHGVDLDVCEGEVLALLGPSGSGKSTLLYCLAGVLVPSKGSVLVGAVDLATLPESERTRLRRQHFGFVLQFGRLVADLTVLENVSLPLRLNGAPRKVAEKQARESLAQVGLSAHADRRSASLSGGEQQRAAVARALIHEPAVVFADEPTGALDSTNGAVVLDLLLSIARDRGSAVVMVTHDEPLATQADRCVRLRDGRIDATADAVAGDLG